MNKPSFLQKSPYTVGYCVKILQPWEMADPEIDPEKWSQNLRSQGVPWGFACLDTPYNQ